MLQKAGAFFSGRTPRDRTHAPPADRVLYHMEVRTLIARRMFREQLKHNCGFEVCFEHCSSGLQVKMILGEDPKHDMVLESKVESRVWGLESRV